MESNGLDPYHHPHLQESFGGSENTNTQLFIKSEPISSNLLVTVGSNSIKKKITGRDGDEDLNSTLPNYPPTSTKSFFAPTNDMDGLKVPKVSRKSTKVQNNSILLRRRSSLSAELEGRGGSKKLSEVDDDDEDFYPELQLLGASSSYRNGDDLSFQNQSTRQVSDFVQSPSSFPSHVGRNSDNLANNKLSISPRHHTHLNVHSSMSLLSMSTNNAITVVPSRNTKIIEPNVFDTGASRHVHVSHKRNGGGGRRRRSKTPEPHSYPQSQSLHNDSQFSYYGIPTQASRRSRNNGESEDTLQNVLSRLDHRIKSRFGDWSNIDEDVNFEYRSTGRIPQQANNYFNYTTTHGGQTIKNDGGDQSTPPPPILPVALPPLYKNYHSVLKSSKGKLLDSKTHRSKDNNDPNSILSQAKRTLTQVGGGKVPG